MADVKLPQRAGDKARPESELSQILARAPELIAVAGPRYGTFLIFTAIMKTRGPWGMAVGSLAVLLYKYGSG
ncbi:hypothetical protein ABIA40_002517 [Bradyrhizobium sp. USDA 223]